MIPAIRTGNGVIIKPSHLTPLATIRLAELMNDVLPAGVVNVVPGDNELGTVISSHPGIHKIVFTGSKATGEKFMASGSVTLKRMTLELGGNDAGIVLPDVDPQAVNKHGAIQPNAPFGGLKSSGLGLEFGLDRLKEFTTVQTVFC